MPMKRHLYPSNWRTIAYMIKYLADWKCQECDRPCRRPGESWDALESRLEKKHREWYYEFYEEIYDETGEWITNIPKRQRFTLTVAHLDQNPGNNARENLKALCPTCHNRHDAPHRAKNAKRTRFKNRHKGQLNLF